MRIAYFDCFSGISGQMVLAALVDAGADLDQIASFLQALPVGPFTLEAERAEVRGVTATHVAVDAPPQEVIRTYTSMRALIEGSDLPDEPKRLAQRAYRLLAEAAGRVGEKEPDLVAFHEWGPLDCVIDLVGPMLALDMLGVERVFASPVPTGLGMARTEHGLTPIPSPVVQELLQGVPTYSRGIPVELVTPTGAALLAAVVEGYGDRPLMRSDRVGYGAGHLRMDAPNALRVVVGREERAGTTSLEAPSGDSLIEAAFDLVEMETAQRIMDQVIDAGARDAWATAGIGPGGQPRVTISAVAGAAHRDAVGAALRAAGPIGDGVRTSPAGTI
jgi:uncharacterized protein (TIGR00299 family) protein